MELEASAREQEAHELRLAQGRGKQVIALIERAFDAVAVPVPRELLGELLRGGEVTPEIAAAAREEVRRAIAAGARAQILAELEAERLARPAPPAGEDDGSDAQVVDGEKAVSEQPDGGPTWEDLDESWKSRFRLNPSLGVREYENALKREQREREERVGAARHSRRDALDFSHTALQGHSW